MQAAQCKSTTNISTKAVALSDCKVYCLKPLDVVGNWKMYCLLNFILLDTQAVDMCKTWIINIIVEREKLRGKIVRLIFTCVHQVY